MTGMRFRATTRILPSRLPRNCRVRLAAVAALCHAGVAMRDTEIIESELMEISAIADDSIKLERIIVWCASHPDEVALALHMLMGRRDKRLHETSEA